MLPESVCVEFKIMIVSSIEVTYASKSVNTSALKRIHNELVSTSPTAASSIVGD